MRAFSSGHPRRPSRFGPSAVFMLVVALLWATGFLAGCSRDSKEKQATENVKKGVAVAVTVGQAEERAASVEMRASGSVQAHATVHVRAQVTGRLVSVHFKEGGQVKKGDLLFSIDPRPFEARIMQARADLARHTAQLRNAGKQVESYASMLKKGYVAKARYDEVVAGVTALEAEIEADRAVLENAKLELKYCSIHSPMDGFAGQLGVDEGNIVKAYGDSLVVISQTDPVFAAFSIPEASLPQLKRHMSDKTLKVRAVVPGDEDRPVPGELTFMDNKVDSESGALALKAVFPNGNGALWPGQSVGVLLTLPSSGEGSSVVVPSQAVRTGQGGQYVYVVRPDHTVELRPVVAGRIMGHEAVIAKGVAPGETVVKEEQANLASGSMVRIASEVLRKTKVEGRH